MCGKVAVDTCLSALKLLLDWFVINKLLEKLNDIVFFNYKILMV